MAVIPTFISLANTDNTTHARSFGINEDDFPNTITTFETIRLFFPNAIGIEYSNSLPEGYLYNLFSTLSDKYPFEVDETLTTEEKTAKQTEYNVLIASLESIIKTILKPYLAMSNYSDGKQYVKEIDETVKLANKLIPIQNEDGLIDNAPVAIENITYKNFPSIQKHLNNIKVEKRTLSDFENVLDIFGQLSALSAYFTSKENSFRKFTSEIIMRMYGNSVQMCPRSIVNYTAFQYCDKGYPYETSSGKVYSISNVNRLNNKLEAAEIYFKNVDAIISFLSDITFIEKTDSNKMEYDKWVLKEAYGVCIGLIGLYGETTLYNSLKNGIFNVESMASKKPWEK